MNDSSFYYNLVDAVVYFVAATIPIFFIKRLDRKRNDKNKHLLNITILLVIFILVQGIYHIFSIMGFKLLTKGIMEPLSIAALLSFAAIYFVGTLREKKLHRSKV